MLSLLTRPVKTEETLTTFKQLSMIPLLFIVALFVSYFLSALVPSAALEIESVIFSVADVFGFCVFGVLLYSSIPTLAADAYDPIDTDA